MREYREIRTFVVCVLLGFVAFQHADAAPHRYPLPVYPISEQSVAWARGTESILVNPAAMKAFPCLELSYVHSFSDSTFNGDNGVSFTRGGIGGSYYSLRLGGESAINSWTIALASGYGSSVSVGGSFTLYKTDRKGYNNDKLWSAGTLFKVGKSVTLAAVAGNIGRMKFEGVRTDVEYTAGGALNLLNGKLCLAADHSYLAGQKISDGTTKGFAELEIGKEVVVKVHAVDTGFFGGGLSWMLGESEITGYAFFDDEARFQYALLKYSRQIGLK